MSPNSWIVLIGAAGFPIVSFYLFVQGIRERRISYVVLSCVLAVIGGPILCIVLLEAVR